ncbi:YaiO family outer membrane beta-barrel protein [Aurantiacibacter spongiae]|uniref:YaiO family outer membrane beta-barrel protein n=1 Tax=Aurantiacibacter spongiae TaxID=2488860 RepID=A0A3N5DPE5_9SPHN|nr:YaiO family outer membrane beta-barrel protein [Aurantiacibacter spongiae]RPF70991.1 YaiO family outer membrane beta-barrel protein [Aurantiacibacter spongiae]
MKHALFALGAILLAGSAPARAQDDAYAAAVAARRNGDPLRAISILEPIIAADPRNSDARVQLGYALLAAGRLDAAEEQFRAVVAAAPDYTDAREGLALIAQRRTHPADERGFVQVEGALSDLGEGIADWQETAIAVALPAGATDRIGAGLNWYRRFGGIEDTEASLSYVHRSGDDTWLRLGASFTPQADYRPEAGLSVGLDHRLTAGRNALVAGLEGSWRRFPAQDVWQISPSLTRYVASGRGSVTVRVNALAPEGDDLRLGAQARFDWHPAERRRLFVGTGYGPETALGVVTDTWSLYGGGEWPLGEGLSLVGSLAREWRDGPVDRTEARLGVRVAL